MPRTAPFLSRRMRQRARASRHRRLQNLGAHQRHVAVQHQHGRIVGNGRHGLLQRMGGAQLLGLQHPAQILAGEVLAHLLRAMPMYDMHRSRVERLCGVEHVPEHGFAADRVQHLGQA
jgi:hypothetical protein